jgi:hypothetical protein
MVAAEEFESVTAIFESVLRCKKVSSYERIRSFLNAESIQITCDQFPYGVMVEFELKGDADERTLLNAIKSFGLDPKHASKLSCDDMYHRLCIEQNITPSSDIIFNDPTMPKIK